MQSERLMKVVKRYQNEVLNMIEERVQRSVYHIEVVRVVLQVLGQKYLKEQINLVLKYMY